jgi:DnaJ-class molecular chaperone
VTIILIINDYGFFVECPVCKGEGIDLEGYVCWKCKGQGQIRYEDITRD